MPFPYHYGSHATPSTWTPSYTYLFVSIPLWFSRNRSKMNLRHVPLLMFPYHYGSHATAFITKILYRFWAGGIKWRESSHKSYSFCISEICLDSIREIVIGFRVKNWPVSSKKGHLSKILGDTFQQKLTEENCSRFRFQSNDLSTVGSM